MTTWNKLGLHAKPVVLGNTSGFSSRFVDLIDEMADEGFLSASDRAIVSVAGSVEEALDRLVPAVPAAVRVTTEGFRRRPAHGTPNRRGGT
ncbi:LOG family protein [Streptomyces sp. NPDC001514]